MKYIISEQQNDRLKRIMFHILDSYLTPFGGWKPEEYVRILKSSFSDNELFIDLKEMDIDAEFDEHNHMLYSMCENPNYTYTDDSQCPEVRIPSRVYELMDDSFGKRMWQSYFIEWFEHHSSLPVNYVGRIY